MRTVRENIFSEESFTEENEDFTRKKLKNLLGEQTKKNETLCEKNFRLTAQLRSLLQLLQKKDFCIVEGALDLKRLKRSEKLGKVMGGIWKKTLKNAVVRIERESFCKRIYGKIGFFVWSIWNQKCKKVKNWAFWIWKKKIEKMRGFCRIFEWVRKKVLKKGFGNIKVVINSKIFYGRKVGKGMVLVLGICERRYRASQCFKDWKVVVKPKNWSLVWEIKRIFRSRLRSYFRDVWNWGFVRKNEGIEKEYKGSTEKCFRFMKKFVNLTALCGIKKKTDLIMAKNVLHRLKPSVYPEKNPLFLVFSLKKILKQRFSLLFRKRPNLIILSILKSHQATILSTSFHKILHFSYKFFTIPSQTPSNITAPSFSSLSANLKASQIALTEIKTDVSHLKSTLSQLKHQKNPLSSILTQKTLQINDLQGKLSKIIADFQELQSESAEKSSFYSQNNEKLEKEVEKNNKNITELENSIEYYCEAIINNENEGRSASLQLAQLQSSYKKVQEMYTTALNDKNRLNASETETKKQKIYLAGKIDNLAEEKENLLGKLRKSMEEIQEVSEGIRAKTLENKEILEKIVEMKEKGLGLIEKKKEMRKSLEEECDVKSSLLFHKQNELKKVKDALFNSRSQLDMMVKELKRTQQLKNSEESKGEEFLKEIGIENEKIAFAKAFAKKLEAEKERLIRENEKIREKVVEITEENLILNSQISGAEAENKRIFNERPGDDTEALRKYASSLEEKVKVLTISLSSSAGISNFSEKQGLEERIKKLQEQLDGCNEFAIRSRKEVSEAISEIENYANILVIMEEKMVETEQILQNSLKIKESAYKEVSEIRQQYYSLISKPHN